MVGYTDNNLTPEDLSLGSSATMLKITVIRCCLMHKMYSTMGGTAVKVIGDCLIK